MFADIMLQRMYRSSYLLRLTLVIMIACGFINPTELRSQECEKVKITDFPQKDLQQNLDTITTKKQDSYKYYYGIGVPIDYTKARQLAFIEMKIDSSGYDPFEGPSILMMLYANGFGVKRNLDISLRLACANVNGAQAEIEGRMQHLRDLMSKSGSKTIDTFDICDDITSGYMMGWCSSLESEKAEIQRTARINSIIAHWSPGELSAYKKLRQTASKFFSKKLDNEVDLSGTARAMVEINENDKLEDDFENKIVNSDKCDFRNYSLADLQKADKELNAVYLKILGIKNFEWGTVNQSGIKSTQREWIKYRDAWASFVAIKCPQVSLTSIKTLITKLRIEDLKSFLDQ